MCDNDLIVLSPYTNIAILLYSNIIIYNILILLSRGFNFMKVIVIGGGAAGASCAARIRRNDEQAEVEIFEKTDEISIANCGLPYYIGLITVELNL